MFTDFAKLFSSDFILGFYFPSMLFVIAATVVYFLFHQTASDILLCLWAQKDWAIPCALFISWVLGVLLLAANSPLVRFLEGYYLLRHTFLLKRQQRKFNELGSDIADMEEKHEKELKNKEPSPEAELMYMKKLIQRRVYYPDKRGQVLPTEFGNVMRAFETYSTVMYGMDSIPLWPRLSAIIPEAYMEALNAARAKMDFTINMVYLAAVIFMVYCIFAALTETLPALWIAGLAILIMWGAYRMAIINAIQWGNLVKSSFDLYRYDLLKQMGLERPASWEQERDLWTAISPSFLYWYHLKAARANDKEVPPTSGGSKVTSGGVTHPD
ncbi:MAG: hypothetical protein Q7T38_02560 [Gallionella sp.]|nr:hypothetical protein [Gallionella sp.]